MPRKNLVLIGMPGSGKTILGKAVAPYLKMRFIDIDKYIEQREKKTINDIFNDGEKHFRDIEEYYISSLKSTNHAVISTGGGVVLRENNIKNLKRNGVIIFINRPLDNIIKNMTNGKKRRPLLKDGLDKIYELYEARIHLYKKYSDFEIQNDDTIYKAKYEIIKTYRQFRFSKGG